VVVVEGELVGDPQADEQGDRHTGSEAREVDKRMRSMLLQIAYGDDEKVSKHVLVLEFTRIVARKVPVFLHTNNQLVAIS